MANVFENRFFSTQPPEVPLDLEDDPQGCPEREFHPLTEEEIGALLLSTENNSSQGPSGQGWRLIKWAWYGAPGQAKRLTRLFNAFISAGCHSREWRESHHSSDPQAQPCRLLAPKITIGQSPCSSA